MSSPSLTALARSRPGDYKVATRRGEPRARSPMVHLLTHYFDEGWVWRDLESYLGLRNQPPIRAMHNALRGRFKPATMTNLARIAEQRDLELLSVWGLAERNRDRGLRKLQALGSLKRLRIGGARMNGRVLAFTEGMPSLTQLCIRGCAADLRPLRALPCLRDLRIPGARLSAPRIRSLGRLEGLTTLDLSGSPITNEQMRALEPLGRLERLGLRRTKLDDEGLRTVGRLTELRELDLCDLPLGDPGMGHLRPLQKLKRLDVWGKITDAGLAHIAALSSLEELRVSGKHLTDAGIERLYALGNLRSLTLGVCDVSDEALTRLARTVRTDDLVVDRMTTEEWDDQMDRAF